MPPAAASTPMAKPSRFTEAEFSDFLAAQKVAEGDLVWTWDTNHVGCAKLVKPVPLRWGHRLFEIRGTYNPLKLEISYTVLHPRLSGCRRIYALDHGGHRHKNPDQRFVGSLHKHRWSERYLDQDAYEPTDISKPPTDIEGVWREFCDEALIRHDGVFFPLPPRQEVFR